MGTIYSYFKRIHKNKIEKQDKKVFYTFKKNDEEIYKLYKFDNEKDMLDFDNSI